MDYNNGGNGIRVVSPEDYEPVYKRLYATCIVGEAKNAWDIWVKPLHSDRKDIIDSLTEILSTGLNRGALITLWRRLSDEYIQVSIMRSEEHTSELQSLMLISSAVFSLKKKQRTSLSTRHPS